MKVHVSLAMMQPGREGTVVEIGGGLGLTRRLEAMGVRPGVILAKVCGLPVGGPVVVRVGNARLALGYGMASKITVEVEAP